MISPPGGQGRRADFLPGAGGQQAVFPHGQRRWPTVSSLGAGARRFLCSGIGVADGFSTWGPWRPTVFRPCPETSDRVPAQRPKAASGPSAGGPRAGDLLSTNQPGTADGRRAESAPAVFGRNHVLASAPELANTLPTQSPAPGTQPLPPPSPGRLPAKFPSSAHTPQTPPAIGAERRGAANSLPAVGPGQQPVFPPEAPCRSST